MSGSPEFKGNSVLYNIHAFRMWLNVLNTETGHYQLQHCLVLSSYGNSF